MLCTSLCTSLCSFVQCYEFCCAVLFEDKENKFLMVINPKVHFVMIYIFEFYIFEYTFSNFYILLCLFSIMFIRKSMKC